MVGVRRICRNHEQHIDGCLLSYQGLWYYWSSFSSSPSLKGQALGGLVLSNPLDIRLKIMTRFHRHCQPLLAYVSISKFRVPLSLYTQCMSLVDSWRIKEVLKENKAHQGRLT